MSKLLSIRFAVTAFFSAFSLFIPGIVVAQHSNVICDDLYNGKAEIIARNSIRLIPGFIATNGCDLRAWIDPSLEMPILEYNPTGGSIVINAIPSNDQNYTLTTTLREATTDPDNIQNICKVQTVQYFDGLGRPMQTVVPKGSPQMKDMVSTILYDNAGHIEKEYLPYISSDNNGCFKNNAPFECITYYSQTQGTIAGREPDIIPFTTIHYDNSPLNRKTGITPQGQDWVTHPTTIRYTTNANDVLHWKVNSTESFTSFYFPANNLYVEETTDEDGNMSRIFTDKLGKKVLEEIVNADNTSLKTSYIYDDFGLLRCVVPPKNHDSGPSPELSYYYNYDSDLRMIEKRLPGADWIYYIYDKRDRLVLWQDGMNRTENLWQYQLYDAINRPVVTGILISEHQASSIRYAFSNYSEVLFETFSSNGILYGYSGISFPITYRPSISTVKSATYYDNYDFKPIFPGNYDFPAIPPGGNIDNQYLSSGKGLITGSLEFSSSNENLLTVNYYDNKLRLICSVNDNHLAGRNNQFFKYNFNNQVIEMIETHNSLYQPIISLRYNYLFDHSGRMLAENLSVNNSLRFTIQALEYNELGEPVSTYLHNAQPGIAGSGFNQEIMKRYNIRGWLSRINDPASLDHSLFACDLRYQNPVNESSIGVEPCFNGNISQLLWNSKFDERCGYGFSYDNHNRLTEAIYADGDNYTSNYGLYNTAYSYDNNGNLTTLGRKRNGQMIDNLVYNYGTWGNKINSINDAASDDGYMPNNGSYIYDLNGNTTYDPSRKISINYNEHNLPSLIEFGPDDIINFYYSSLGTKESKRVLNWHSTPPSLQTDYCGNFIYSDNSLCSISTSICRLVPVLYDGEVFWKKEYNLTDHLGNVRVTFSGHGNGQPEVMQQTSYYPFGYTLKQNNFYSGTAYQNRFLYNGKELQNDVMAGSRLDWYDYGARFYDAQLGRFLSVDPLSEKFSYQSPFVYASNNPILFIDKNGESPIILPAAAAIAINTAVTVLAVAAIAYVGYYVATTPPPAINQADFQQALKADISSILHYNEGFKHQQEVDAESRRETSDIIRNHTEYCKKNIGEPSSDGDNEIKGGGKNGTKIGNVIVFGALIGTISYDYEKSLEQLRETYKGFKQDDDKSDENGVSNVRSTIGPEPDPAPFGAESETFTTPFSSYYMPF